MVQIFATCFENCMFNRVFTTVCQWSLFYGGADKSLARPTPQCILFDGENISFGASLVIYTNGTNIPPIMVINSIYENQNLLSLYLVSFLVRLRTYQHPCKAAESSANPPTLLL